MENKKELTTNKSNIAESDARLAMVNLSKKMSLVKNELGAISKDSKNPFFNSKYFDINQLLHHVEPILHKHGLICLQPIIENKVVTEIIDIDSGESYTSQLELPQLNDPQKLGSCITYFRRYTLSSLLALQSEDNDGNNLKPKPIEPKPIPSLNAEQFTLAMKSDAKGITATLKAITDGKITAGANQINSLNKQLLTLNK